MRLFLCIFVFVNCGISFSANSDEAEFDHAMDLFFLGCKYGGFSRVEECRRLEGYLLLIEQEDAAERLLRRRIENLSAPEPFATLLLNDMIRNRSLEKSNLLDVPLPINLLKDGSFEDMLGNGWSVPEGFSPNYIKSSRNRLHGKASLEIAPVQKGNNYGGAITQEVDSIVPEDGYEFDIQFTCPANSRALKASLEVFWHVDNKWVESVYGPRLLSKLSSSSVPKWHTFTAVLVAPLEASRLKLVFSNVSEDREAAIVVDYATLVNVGNNSKKISVSEKAKILKK